MTASTLSTTGYYVLNSAPLLFALPAATLAGKRWAQELTRLSPSGREEIRQVGRDVMDVTRPLWGILFLWCLILVGQTLFQLFFAPVSPHLANNLFRATSWSIASAGTFLVAIRDIWRRPAIVQRMWARALAEAERIVRTTL